MAENISMTRTINNIQENFSEFVKDNETAEYVFAYVSLNIDKHDFAISDEKDFEVLHFIAAMNAQAEEDIKKNAIASTMNLDDPEYGLVPEKPIYTNGVSGSKRYLRSLMPLSREPITWERKGSMSVKSLNGMIDIYCISLSSGEEYKTIYINMYADANSQKAPVGFSIDVSDNESRKRDE